MRYEEEKVFFRRVLQILPQELVDYIAMVLIKSIFLQDQNQLYSMGLFLLQIPRTRVIFELWVYIKTGSSEPR